MGDKSKIEWTDASWNPIVGCSLVSPGCTNCYAMALAARIQRMTPASHYAGTTKEVNGKPVWTGKLVKAPPHILTQPLRWKSPRMIFVNSMSDLFHDAVPDAWIDEVFAVMALCGQHAFQVLTKRPERMRAYMHKLEAAHAEILGMFGHPPAASAEPNAVDEFPHYASSLAHPSQHGLFPLPNVWLGTSAEDQKRADERIPDLLRTPAAVRFISAEPLLGPIDLTNIEVFNGDAVMDAISGQSDADIWKAAWAPEVTGTSLEEAIDAYEDWGGSYPPSDAAGRKLDWVIAGGESGRGARPMHPDWARGLRDQCAAAGVPFFFKQWGEFLPDRQRTGVELLNNGHGIRVGKRAAGRLLDGREHNDMPERANG